MAQDSLPFSAATREEQLKIATQVFEQVPSYDISQDTQPFSVATREEQLKISRRVLEQVPSRYISGLSKTRVEQSEDLRIAVTNILVQVKGMDLIFNEQEKLLCDAQTEIARLRRYEVELTDARAEIVELKSLLEHARLEAKKGRLTVLQLDASEAREKASQLELDILREELSLLRKKLGHDVQQLSEKKECSEEQVKNL